MGTTYESVIKVGAEIAKNLTPDALKSARALKALTEDVKKLKAAEKAAAGYKKLTDAVAKSKTKVDQAAAALRRLEEAERAAGGATKESTQWRKAGERALAAANREMDRSTKAAERNAKAMRELGLDTANVVREQARLAAAGKFAAARTRIFGAHKDKDPVPLAQKAGDQMRGIARDVAVIGTAALGAGAAMTGLVLRSISVGDEIGDTADKLGIGAKALQELRYGAIQSGAKTEDLDKALGKMLITVGKFKAAKGKGGSGGGVIPGLEMLGTGGGSQQGGEQDPFKRIGLNAKALSALKPEEQIRKIADGMQKLKTKADRAAVGAAIFGKSFLELDPLMRDGTAGLDKLSAAAHKYGGVMSDAAVEAAGKADAAMNDAKMAAAGLASTLGSALLPTATRVFTQFAEWVAANRGQIQAWAENAAKWIETKAIPAIIKIGGELKSFGEKVMWLAGGAAKLVGGFDNLAIAAGALRLAPIAVTLSKIGIEGAKATTALLKFAAANAGAGGAGGAGLGMLGKAGLVGAAGAAGYALGSWVDEKAGISDWISGTGRSNRTKSSEDALDVERDKALAARLAQIRAQNERNRQARLLPEVGSVAGAAMSMPQAGAGNSTQIPISVNIQANTREQLVSGMNQARDQAVEQFDRKRMSFSE